MNTTLLTALCALAVPGFVPVSSVACSTNFTALSVLAVRAVSPDAAEARGAIAKLRAAGPVGLDALLKAHSEQVQNHIGRDRGFFPQPSPSEGAAWERVR